MREKGMYGFQFLAEEERGRREKTRKARRKDLDKRRLRKPTRKISPGKAREQERANGEKLMRARKKGGRKKKMP